MRFKPAHRLMARRARARSTQDLAHRAPGDAEIVLAIGPDWLVSCQSHPDLVDEFRGLQRLSGALMSQQRAGDPTQLVVHLEKQVVRDCRRAQAHSHSHLLISVSDPDPRIRSAPVSVLQLDDHVAAIVLPIRTEAVCNVPVRFLDEAQRFSGEWIDRHSIQISRNERFDVGWHLFAVIAPVTARRRWRFSSRDSRPEHGRLVFTSASRRLRSSCILVECHAGQGSAHRYSQWRRFDRATDALAA